MFDDLRRNFVMNPSNGLKIRPFRKAHMNRDSDRELLDLSKYLMEIAKLEVKKLFVVLFVLFRSLLVQLLKRPALFCEKMRRTSPSSATQSGKLSYRRFNNLSPRLFFQLLCTDAQPRISQ